VARREFLHNKRFEQTPDSNISIHGNPGFYVLVWPLRARFPQGTAQLKRSVILLQVIGESFGFRLGVKLVVQNGNTERFRIPSTSRSIGHARARGFREGSIYRVRAFQYARAQHF